MNTSKLEVRENLNATQGPIIIKLLNTRGKRKILKATWERDRLGKIMECCQMFNNMLSGEENMACNICGFYSINTPIWPISVCPSDVAECWGWNWRLQSTLTRQNKLASAHHCTQENKLKNGSRFLLRSKASKRTKAQLKLVIEVTWNFLMEQNIFQK